MARQYQSSNLLSITRMRKAFAKRFVYLLLTGVFALSLVVYFGSGPFGSPGNASQEYMEQPVVTVNGEDVPRVQYENMTRQMRGGDPMQSLMIEGMVLNQMVDQALQRSIAKKRGLQVSDADIEKQMLEEKKRLGGDKPVSEDEFREYLDKQGVSVSEYREELTERLLPTKLQQEITKGIIANEEELKKSYDEVNLRHVLVDTKKLPEAQAKAKAEKILAEAESGANFAALADKYSDDPSNRVQKFDEKAKKMVDTGVAKGGDLGWTKVSSLTTAYVPEFGEAAKKLEPGQISDTVKTQFGFHIIKVEKKRSSLPKDFEKTKTKLLEDYKTQQSSQKYQQFLEEQRKTMKVVWHDPNLEWRHLYSKTNPMMMGMPGASGAGSQEALEKKLREHLKNNAADSAAALVLGKQLYQTYVMAAPGPAREKARDETIKFYEMALQSSEDQETRLSLAQLYRDAGKKDQALKHYRTTQRLLGWDDSPSTKPTQQQLEKAFNELGDKESADRARKRIAQLTEIEKKEAAEKKAAEAKAKEEAKKNAAKPPAKPGTVTVADPKTPTSGAITVTKPDEPAGPKKSTAPGHEGHDHD